MICLLLLFGLKLVAGMPTAAQGTFKVGVYDQGELIENINSSSSGRQEALVILLKQLSIYESNANIARTQGAVVQVFPEYGLMPLSATREQGYYFTEYVPDPSQSAWNPCTEPRPDTEIQQRLSCIAANNSIYIVANMGSRDPCDPATDANCPADGRYQYNTNVVFDPTGQLISRYRKYNLFDGEPIYNTPTEVDYSYFDTPYGRFGTFICFDIIYKRPTVDLIETYKIQHALFPTAWMNELPYYSAVTFHQGVAVGLGVNLIASNLHYPVDKFCGSGIYGSDQTYAFRHNETATESALLVAEIPVKPNITVQKKTTFPDDLENQVEFQEKIYGDVFSVVTLNSDSGTASVCQGTLCCLLTYTRQPGSNETYALGAFAGGHGSKDNYYLQLCSFLKCSTTNGSRCSGDAKTSNTHFSFFNLTGNFSTPYVYPSVVSSGIDPSSGDWVYTGQYVISHGTKKPFLSATLYGRVFDLDGQPRRDIFEDFPVKSPVVADDY